MNLSKSSPRGTPLLDPVNKILFFQWNDNKVTFFASSLGVCGMATILHSAGVDKSKYPIAEALEHYATDSFMGGVDNMDKDKKIGGSFTNCAMFQKWYQMILMDVFGFMLVNRRQAKDMSTDVIEDRFKLNNVQFRWGLAEELLQFKDNLSVSCLHEAQLSHITSMIASGHQLQKLPPKGKCSLLHLPT